MVAIDKEFILRKLCYTDLVYGRINKKLGTSYSRSEVKEFVYRVLSEAESWSKVGKNYYIVNSDLGVRVTVNSFTFRVITADLV